MSLVFLGFSRMVPKRANRKFPTVETYNKTFYNKSVYEYTANLCANALGQYIFGAISDISHNEINRWYSKLRDYYYPLMKSMRNSILEKIGNFSEFWSVRIFQHLDYEFLNTIRM